MSVKNLEKLEAWRKAQEFCLRVYREILPLLPPEEKWNLGQQMRHSALSIPANVAEGHGRFSYQDNVRFCYNARGSLEETLSHLVISGKLNYIPVPLVDSLVTDGEHLTQLINGYIGYLKRSKQGQSEPGADRSVKENPSSYEVEQPDSLTDQ